MIYNAFPSTTGEVEEGSINGTAEVPFKEIGLKGNTSQNGEPTPDTPIPINVVSGDNEVVLCRKNLINFEDIQYTLTNSYYRDFDTGIVFTQDMVGKIFSVSYDIEITNYTGTPALFSGVTGRSSNPPTMQHQLVAKTNTIASGVMRVKVENVTIPNNVGQHLILRPAGFSVPITGTFKVSNVQIEWGKTATDYEPYQGKSYPISLGSIELCKIGDYQDRIYKDNGKWYLNKQIGKVVLDGSESWYQWEADSFYITRLSTIRTGLSNYYKYNANVTGASQLSNGEFFIHDNTNNNVVIFRNTSITTLADFKTWLGTHNTEVYYVLATPTYTEITDTTLIEQLDNLEKAYSYDTQTNISQTNQDKPFIISYEAILSLRNVLMERKS